MNDNDISKIIVFVMSVLLWMFIFFAPICPDPYTGEYKNITTLINEERPPLTWEQLGINPNK